ncbi:hypothetical protein, partial [Stenotrophomonas maltophilia]|uniref:hypothetical protein n=1 Tax=Stenotrophomonas maltophilia TaxID=40324 RepID=UPI00195323D7
PVRDKRRSLVFRLMQLPHDPLQHGSPKAVVTRGDQARNEELIGAEQPATNEIDERIGIVALQGGQAGGGILFAI